MIARITGTLVSKRNNMVLIEVNGVGYEIEMPLIDACELLEYGQIYALHTHFVVREDAHLLFGFIKEDRRDLFRLLIKVNGVGPKVALAILSALDVEELVSCIQEEDIPRLIKVPGIGKKTAERLIIEMRDRLVGWAVTTPTVNVGSSDQSPSTLPLTDPVAEARNALESLGYKPAEAEKAVKAVTDVAGKGGSVEEIIRKALRGMVKS
jgi:Holliday junction DNA helicase RuvA